MIILKLRSLSTDKKEIEILPKERLDSAVNRCLEDIDLLGKEPGDIFIVLVNGQNIDKEMWPTIYLNIMDSVLIAPKLRGGDDGSLLRGVITVVGLVVAAVATQGLSLGWQAAAMTAASMATALIANALIPPTVPTGGTDNQGSLSESQMYSFSGQSNSLTPYGFVPKVYGTHKMFPRVAANPYIELTVNPANGELANYFTCIYDFGLGPAVVEEIKIGDTPILNYQDVYVNLVDPNKPVTPEGPWDEETTDTFEFYKSDVTQESVGVALNAQNDTATRTTSVNVGTTQQEIEVSLFFPNGLFSIASNGGFGTSSVLGTIEFSNVLDDPGNPANWHQWNDLAYVKSFSSSGSKDSFVDGILFSPPILYNQLPSGKYNTLNPYNDYDVLLVMNPNQYATNYRMGFAAGRTTFTVKKNPSQVVVGRQLFTIQKSLGTITNVIQHPDLADYNIVTIDTPLVEPIIHRTAVHVSQAYTLYGITIAAGYSISDVGNVGNDGTSSYANLRTKYPNNVFTIEKNIQGANYASFKFTPLVNGQYRVRVTRGITSNQYTYQSQNNMTWQALTSRYATPPIVTDKRHVFLEVRVKATDQLNGSIQNLNAVVTSVLDVYNDATDVWEKAPTNNPAWIFTDLLTGQVNKRAISKDRLHIDSILEWMDFCEEVPDSPVDRDYVDPRFTCNFVLDYESTLQEVIMQVTSMSQAAMNIVDGKYGVLVDKLRTVPVQIFTPRNSREFTSSRSYTVQPNAVKVKYIEPIIDWKITEMIVYDAGFNEGNAETFDELSTFACTSQEQAWRYGRYHIFSNKLRQEQISIKVDFEHLVCTRGDYVQLVQPAMRVGGRPARVATVNGGTDTITIDDKLESTVGSFGYVFRSTADGQIHSDTLTIVDESTFVLNGTLPVVGDLIVIGIVDQEVYDCLVKSITPEDDLSATLILVEKADAIYTAESTNSYPTYNPQLSPLINPFAPPGLVPDLIIADNAYYCNNGRYQHYIDLDWEAPADSSIGSYKIYVNQGAGYTQVAEVTTSFYRYLAIDSDVGKTLGFKVAAISKTGAALELIDLTEITAAVVAKTTPPSDVTGFSVNLTSETAQLSWDLVPDCDIAEYWIRYSSARENYTGDYDDWAKSVTVQRVSATTNMIAFMIKDGYYHIRAVDYGGRLSANKATVLCPQYTVNEGIELDTWYFKGPFDISVTGDFDRTVPYNTLIPNEAYVELDLEVGGADPRYYMEGYYYPVQPTIGIGKFEWDELETLIQHELPVIGVGPGAADGKFDAEIQYRYSGEFTVIADWPDMTSIDPLTEGDAENYTEWQRLTSTYQPVGFYQFRVKLISYDGVTTPRVILAPDSAGVFGYRKRRIKEVPVTSSSSGTAAEITDFMEIATVVGAIQNPQSGDYCLVDFSGTTVLVDVYDATDTRVVRDVVVTVTGFGYKQ